MLLARMQVHAPRLFAGTPDSVLAAAQRRQAAASAPAAVKSAGEPTSSTPRHDRESAESSNKHQGFSGRGLLDALGAMSDRLAVLARAKSTETATATDLSEKAAAPAAASDDAGSGSMLALLGKMFGVKGLSAISLDVSFEKTDASSQYEHMSSDANGYDYHQNATALSSTHLAINGVVKDESGKQFTLSLNYSREIFVTHSVDVSGRTDAADDAGAAASAQNASMPALPEVADASVPAAHASAKHTFLQSLLSMLAKFKVDAQGALARSSAPAATPQSSAINPYLTVPSIVPSIDTAA